MTAPALGDCPPLYIVYNVRSGRGDADATRRAIAEACAAAGRAHHLFVIDRSHRIADQAHEAVRQAVAAGGIVVAAGGDGTINAVAQAALGSGCAFGVLPHGTFNYFSRTHRIPADPAEAMAMLLRSKPQPVQVGQVNERVFLVNASLGLYARLLEERELFKSQFGRSRIVAMGAALVTLLRGHRLWNLRVSSHGTERELRTPTLFVGNNALQLEQIGLPEAEALDNGELAAIALRPVGRLSMLWLLLRASLARLESAGDVERISFRSITVAAIGTSRRRVKVATDGEIAWMEMPLHFHIAPKPLWLVKAAPGEPAPERA